MAEQLVPDASVLAVALVDDGPSGRSYRTRLRSGALSAPELIDLEVTAVIRKQVRQGLLHPDRGEQAVIDLVAMPLTRVPHRQLLRRVWQVRNNLTAYDAAYVAVAELLGATLVTADARLAKVGGPACRIELLPAR